MLSVVCLVLFCNFRTCTVTMHENTVKFIPSAKIISKSAWSPVLLSLNCWSEQHQIPSIRLPHLFTTQLVKDKRLIKWHNFFEIRLKIYPNEFDLGLVLEVRPTLCQSDLLWRLLRVQGGARQVRRLLREVPYPPHAVPLFKQVSWRCCDYYMLTTYVFT